MLAIMRDTVQHVVTVPCPPAKAFEVFVKRFDQWWPSEYTWAQDALDRIWIEPHSGGRCIERHRNGGETVWGVVEEYFPPEHISFSWLIAPDRTVVQDPDRASKVLVQFIDDDTGGTTIELTHTGFSRYGAGWEDYQAGFASPQGWPFLMERLAAAMSAE